MFNMKHFYWTNADYKMRTNNVAKSNPAPQYPTINIFYLPYFLLDTIFQKTECLNLSL
jgi:hypothetical protein